MRIARGGKTSLLTGLVATATVAISFTLACSSDQASAGRPAVPTPAMTGAVATMESRALSPEQQARVRERAALPESRFIQRGTFAMEVGPATSGATVKIANRRIDLPGDVFIADFVVYSWGESDLPRWVFGKGVSAISVSHETGEFSREVLNGAPYDHFDELRAVVSAATD